MPQKEVMTIASLRSFLQDFQQTPLDQYQIWISCDEKGKTLSPMEANPEISVTLNLENQQMILHPHRKKPIF